MVPEAHRKGIDYNGDLPWPTSVFGETLHRDFSLYSDTGVSKLSFYYILRNDLGISPEGPQTKPIILDGQVAYKRNLISYNMLRLKDVFLAR